MSQHDQTDGIPAGEDVVPPHACSGTWRVLIVEDSEDDTLLLVRELQRGGLKVSWQRVQTEADMSRVLSVTDWDVIISAFSVTGFGASSALALLQTFGRDIPFIVVSDTSGEDTAVGMMRAGAQDYLMKENLTRLVPAVTRGLYDAHERRKRRAAETVLGANGHYAHELLNSLRSGVIVVDADSHEIQDINSYALELIGAERENVVNRICCGFICPAQDGNCPVTDLSQDLDHSEHVLLPLEGEPIPILKSVLPVLSEGRKLLIESFLDITDRKKRETQLRLQTTALRAAANAIVITDRDGNISWTNPAFSRLTGYTEEEARGRNPRFLKSGRVAPAVYEDLWHTILAGNVWQGEMINQRKDGTLYTEEMTITPVPGPDNQIAQFIAIKQDVTARKETEGERRALEAQLRQSQKLESLGTLASGVAHEINNPINGIMNYAQLIADRGADAEIREFAGEIIHETHRVARIVRNLLKFARADADYHSPARISDIVDATLSLVRTVMRHDQIALDVDVPADLPMVNCRGQQIQQVIMNLLTNARHALNEKYPGADENKRVSVNARRLDEDGESWVRTTITDFGIGMSSEVRERLFDPFFTTKPRDKGTGLGLYISHGIIRDHGGRLTVDSEPGEYTRFSIDVPLAESSA